MSITSTTLTRADAVAAALAGLAYIVIQFIHPADVIESYRRAGAPVYTALEEVESRRLSEKIAGKTPWTAPREVRSIAICTWNAFALQTLGDALLQADYDDSPATIGFVPPITREQALAFFTQVEGWLARANRFRFDAKAELDVDVPADLPPWVEIDPCPKAHVMAMLAAAKALRLHTEAAWGAFDGGGATDEQRESARRLEGLLTEANAKLDFATSLWGPDIDRAVHEDVEQHAKTAIDGYYRLGQLTPRPVCWHSCRAARSRVRARQSTLCPATPASTRGC